MMIEKMIGETQRSNEPTIPVPKSRDGRNMTKTKMNGTEETKLQRRIGKQGKIVMCMDVDVI